MTPSSKPLHLGEILLRIQVITWEQLDDALEQQRITGNKLGEILLSKGYITHQDLYRALAIHHEMTFWNVKNLKLSDDLMRHLPKEVATEHRVVPVAQKGLILILAVSDPGFNIREKIAPLVPDLEVRPVLACPEDIEEALKKIYG